MSPNLTPQELVRFDNPEFLKSPTDSLYLCVQAPLSQAAQGLDFPWDDSLDLDFDPEALDDLFGVPASPPLPIPTMGTSQSLSPQPESSLPSAPGAPLKAPRPRRPVSFKHPMPSLVPPPSFDDLEPCAQPPLEPTPPLTPLPDHFLPEGSGLQPSSVRGRQTQRRVLKEAIKTVQRDLAAAPEGLTGRKLKARLLAMTERFESLSNGLPKPKPPVHPVVDLSGPSPVASKTKRAYPEPGLASAEPDLFSPAPRKIRKTCATSTGSSRATTGLTPIVSSLMASPPSTSATSPRLVKAEPDTSKDGSPSDQMPSGASTSCGPPSDLPSILKSLKDRLSKLMSIAPSLRPEILARSLELFGRDQSPIGTAVELKSLLSVLWPEQPWTECPSIDLPADIQCPSCAITAVSLHLSALQHWHEIRASHPMLGGTGAVPAVARPERPGASWAQVPTASLLRAGGGTPTDLDSWSYGMSFARRPVLSSTCSLCLTGIPYKWK